jgi:hypothetical protein
MRAISRDQTTRFSPTTRFQYLIAPSFNLPMNLFASWTSIGYLLIEPHELDAAFCRSASSAARANASHGRHGIHGPAVRGHGHVGPSHGVRGPGQGADVRAVHAIGQARPRCASRLALSLPPSLALAANPRSIGSVDLLPSLLVADRGRETSR